MRELSEKEHRNQQRAAWEKRESIQPRDRLVIRCTRVLRFGGKSCCAFRLKSGGELICEQPEDKPVHRGENVVIWCTGVIVKANGYGRYVDYHFQGWNHKLGELIINGPDAQALNADYRFDWKEQDAKGDVYYDV